MQRNHFQKHSSHYYLHLMFNVGVMLGWLASEYSIAFSEPDISLKELVETRTELKK